MVPIRNIELELSATFSFLNYATESFNFLKPPFGLRGRKNSIRGENLKS